jgi:putative addiction module killer protein
MREDIDVLGHDSASGKYIKLQRFSPERPGNAKPIGKDVCSLCGDHGVGYRVYFVKNADVFFVLLAGGDKSTQDRDIRYVKALARDFKEQQHAKDSDHTMGSS